VKRVVDGANGLEPPGRDEAVGAYSMAHGALEPRTDRFEMRELPLGERDERGAAARNTKWRPG